MTTPKYRTNQGVIISYEDTGEGKPLILLHGFCGSSSYWENVTPLLNETYRVITPDLRGHGKSSAPDASVYPMEAFAEDIAQLIDDLELDAPPVVLGHSLGGYVTLALAEKLGDKLAGFGFIHSTACPDTEEGRSNRDKGIKTIEQEGIASFVDGLVPKLFSPDHLVSMPEAVNRAKEIGRLTSPTAAIATQEGMKLRPDRNHVLEQTHKPVLLVAGMRDGIVPVEKTFSVEKNCISGIKLTDAGHMSMMETPELLANAILRYLDGVYGI